MTGKADNQEALALRRKVQAESASNHRKKRHAAFFSILSNGLLVMLKLIVGFWSGSVSVLSEAAHSATDLLASIIAFLSVRAADNPPDEDHPYGHGKIESISGLLEALLIFLAAFYIIYEAVGKLRAPSHSPHTGLNLGLAVMAFSAVTNIFLSRYLRRVARQTDSLALQADAEHLRADVYASIGVFIGLALTRFTPYPWFDPLTALFVALFILLAAYRLTRDALAPLLDERLPSDEVLAIQEAIETHAEVRGYHKLRTRKSGSQRYVDVHVQMDDELTLVAAHDIAEEMEDHIRTILPAAQVIIHIEPYAAELRHQREAHGSENEGTL